MYASDTAATSLHAAGGERRSAAHSTTPATAEVMNWRVVSVSAQLPALGASSVSADLPHAVHTAEKPNQATTHAPRVRRPEVDGAEEAILGRLPRMASLSPAVRRHNHMRLEGAPVTACSF